MDPETTTTIVLFGSIVLWAVWRTVGAFTVWRRLQGDRIVTCPETGRPAAVRIDLRHAIGTLAARPATVRLHACSGWTDRGPCDQRCIPDAERCESAASRIVEARALGPHHAALRGHDGVTREWIDIRGEDLRDALATQLPVCWDCHVAETFRRVHPELVTDRQGH
jgi:hypothetical protein